MMMIKSEKIGTEKMMITVSVMMMFITIFAGD